MSALPHHLAKLAAHRLFPLLSAFLVMSISSQTLAAESLADSDSSFKGKIGRTVGESVPDWPQAIKASKDAPNVVLILLDDVGFAASGAFGGPTRTPALDRLAAEGLRYNRFHVSAQCSPTRAALLSGRNDHQVGFGAVGYGGFPGYNNIWRKDVVPVAEVLKRNGYSTAAFGKWHNTPPWETGPSGPFDRWPTGLGFEYFYGFLTGADSQYEPSVYRNTVPVERPSTPAQGYHFTTDIVDEAIAWMHTSVDPRKPYFLYLAPGATHWPHHVAPKWIEPYRGRFDQGWDRLREEIFARQKKLGVVPEKAALTPRPKELPAWSSLSDDEKKLLSRQMEVYAGFLAHTDHEVGRLLDAVRDSSGADNTLILYIVGDNGASSESGLTGWDVPRLTGWNVPTGGSIKERLEQTSDLGSIRYPVNQYASGWAWAMSTPFQWQKLVASHLGGTRSPLIVSWPARIKSPGGVRSQYTHVNDIAATLYDVAGISFPSIVDGVKQIPLSGVSFADSFTRSEAASTHTLQIYEQWGNRALYKDGWIASARHIVPWIHEQLRNTDYDRDRWELYDLDADFSQAHDLAAKHPQKLQELQTLFDNEARKNNIYPLGGANFVDVPLAGGDQTEFIYHVDSPRMFTASAPNFTRSHRITASLTIPEQGAEGVILSYGGRYSGFVLYVKQSRVIYESHFRGRTTIGSTADLPRGTVAIAYEFAAEKPSPGNAFAVNGQGSIFINGVQAASGRIEGVTRVLEGGVSFNIGRMRSSPISENFEPPFAFTGGLGEVKVELK